MSLRVGEKNYLPKHNVPVSGCRGTDLSVVPKFFLHYSQSADFSPPRGLVCVMSEVSLKDVMRVYL